MVQYWYAKQRKSYFIVYYVLSNVHIMVHSAIVLYVDKGDIISWEQITNYGIINVTLFVCIISTNIQYYEYYYLHTDQLVSMIHFKMKVEALIAAVLASYLGIF